MSFLHLLKTKSVNKKLWILYQIIIQVYVGQFIMPEPVGASVPDGPAAVVPLDNTIVAVSVPGGSAKLE